VDSALCTHCGDCVAACPAEALFLFGRPISVEQTMEEILKDEVFYQNSGGGVTVSGGEPLNQLDFLLNLLKACKQRLIHTCIETSGYSQWDRLAAVLPYVDLVLYDLKHMDPECHRKLTGEDNRFILQNFRRLTDTDKNTVVRFPLIPGLNDDRENLSRLIDFLRETAPQARIELLPYHRLGRSKYATLSRPYPLEDIQPPSAERVEEVRSFLQSGGFEVIVDA
jgi:pyruvate formate lyase activating enzyme